MGFFDKAVDRIFRKRMQKNLPRAQYWYDNQVFSDMQPYMPMVTGAFIQSVRMKNSALAGSGKVCVATGVMGRYLHEGKVMVDSETGAGARPITVDGELIFRHRLGAKLMATDRPLNYSKSAHPLAQAHWEDAAIAEHMEEWKKGIRRVLIHGK